MSTEYKLGMHTIQHILEEEDPRQWFSFNYKEFCKELENRVVQGVDIKDNDVFKGAWYELKRMEKMHQLVEEFNSDKPKTFWCTIAPIREDYIDPDYGVYKRYGVFGYYDWSGPFVLFDDLEEEKKELRILEEEYYRMVAEDEFKKANYNNEN